MDVFTVEGRSLDECRRKMRDLYGERAQIVKQAVTRRGFFRTREIIQVTGIVPPPLPRKMPNAEEEKQKILEEAARRPAGDLQIREILREVRLLNEKVDASAAKTANAAFEHPNLQALGDLLEKNDFLGAYRKKILERARKELSVEVIEDWQELQQRALFFIGETIEIDDGGGRHPLPRVIIIVGPTGVGKTTTIAKLAARYIMGEEDGLERRVSLITIDRYRVAAARQLEEYADALRKSPFAAPASAEELKKDLALQRGNADIILIDTIGRSPRDAIEIAEMKKMLEVCGKNAERHLAVAATTKAADIIDIAAQFEPFGYESVIITKLDETSRLGNVISALAERGKRVSFMTDGQESTHRTIHKADRVRFLINLDGFDVDRNRIEERFTPSENAPGGRVE